MTHTILGLLFLTLGCSEQSFQNQTTEPTVVSSECGDGFHDGYEQCDDGNLIDEDGCSATCLVEYCGDGTSQAGLGEECDDGNMVLGDGCGGCFEEICGDGTIHPLMEEECDDGNSVAEDGCFECTEEYCGDGVLQAGLGEECDDANAIAGDGCDSCIAEYCGDAIVQAGLGEECDDGNTVADDGCNECILEYCGDGIVQVGLGEACDDGNTIDDDDCNNSCQEASEFCPDGGTSVLVNPDFEDGTTTGWSSSGTLSMTTMSHDGSWAASTTGNYYCRQDLATPTPVTDLIKATFWTWHDGKDSPAQSIEWGYSDGTTDSSFLGAADLAGWVQVDLLPEMTAGKALSYIQVWGYSGGGGLVDVTLYDTFEFCE
jgi:cysteine-rich repeat protein